MKRAWLHPHICSNNHSGIHSNEGGIENPGWWTPVLTFSFFFFCPFTGHIDEYRNNNFPVGGKWYWMVANLLERRLLSYLNDLVSILSCSKCVFVCLNAILAVCILFRWGAEQATSYCSRDAGKYSQFHQTVIKPYIRNLWTAILPPPLPPSLFCAFPPTPLLQSSLYSILCYIQAYIQC